LTYHQSSEFPQEIPQPARQIAAAGCFVIGARHVTVPDQIIGCTTCEHSFDAMDDRAFISARDSESVALCPLCYTLLRSSEEWAIWNSCNGPFEIFPRRALAHAAIKDRYAKMDVEVVPIRAIREPEDNRWHRQIREDELEKRRA
jgi:hypothetical protein